MPRTAVPDPPGMSIVHRGERLPSGQHVPSARACVVDAQPVVPPPACGAELNVGLRAAEAAHPGDLPLLGRHPEQLVMAELLDDLRAGNEPHAGSAG
jgi:hypothetical protein